MKLETKLIHHSYKAPDCFQSIQPAIYKASSIIFPNCEEQRTRKWKDRSSYTYGLHGTPTTYELEKRLCELEGANYCILTPSGLSAITTTSLALLNNGDEVLIPHNVYNPNKEFSLNFLIKYGIIAKEYDALDIEDLQNKINSKTKLIWIEAPGSITMEFPDIINIIKLAKSKNILVALDNTWGAGLAFKPFDILDDGEVVTDVSIHALTKYPNGTGDILMGSITTINQEIHQKILLTHMHLGLNVGANDIESILKGLPSIKLRYYFQDKNARYLAKSLQNQDGVIQLLHPAFESGLGHENWQQICGKTNLSASLFSVVFSDKFTQNQIDIFCNNLNLFKLAYSWGGHTSLAMFYKLTRSVEKKRIKEGFIIRFHVGLEDKQDLENDLAQSYEKAFNLKWKPN